MTVESLFMTSLFKYINSRWPSQFAIDPTSSIIINKPVNFLREYTGLSNDIAKGLRCCFEGDALEIQLIYIAKGTRPGDGMVNAQEFADIARAYLEPIQFDVMPEVTLAECGGYISASGEQTIEPMAAGSIEFKYTKFNLPPVSTIAYLLHALQFREAQYFIPGFGCMSETQAKEHYRTTPSGWSSFEIAPASPTVS